MGEVPSTYPSDAAWAGSRLVLVGLEVLGLAVDSVIAPVRAVAAAVRGAAATTVAPTRATTTTVGDHPRRPHRRINCERYAWLITPTMPDSSRWYLQ